MNFSITPVKTQHSLDNCTLFFIFSKPTKNAFENIREDDLSKLLGEHAEIKRIKTKTTDTFEVLRCESIEWKIITKKTLIGFECYNYLRWNDFFETIQNFISFFFEHIKEDLLVTGLGLSVVDAFDVEGKGDFNLRQLFNEKSKFIPLAFLDAHYPFASTSCDYVEKIDDVLFIQTINISAEVKNKNLFFPITHEMRTKFTTESCPVKDFQRNHWEEFKQNINAMHTANKATLRDILFPQVLDKIGL